MKRTIFFTSTLSAFLVCSIISTMASEETPKVVQFSYKLNDETTFQIVHGNICKQNTTVIVNAANDALLRGGGVCGAIFNAAQDPKALQKACHNLTTIKDQSLHCQEHPQYCAPGDAAITPSFFGKDSPITHIIHAVGPNARHYSDHSIAQETLMKTYSSALVLADKSKIQSISFPLISSNRFGFTDEDPKKPLNAELPALKAIAEYVKTNPKSTIKDIRLIAFDTATAGRLKDVIEKHLSESYVSTHEND